MVWVFHLPPLMSSSPCSYSTIWVRPSDRDGDGISAAEDCDDFDPNVLTDCDGDGFFLEEDCDDLDETSTIVAEDLDCDGILDPDDLDVDGDGFLRNQDCDDFDATRSVFDGRSKECALNSCQRILEKNFSEGDGLYWIDSDGTGGVETFCDMTLDDGGWTLAKRLSVELGSPDWFINHPNF